MSEARQEEESAENKGTDRTIFQELNEIFDSSNESSALTLKQQRSEEPQQSSLTGQLLAFDRRITRRQVRRSAAFSEDLEEEEASDETASFFKAAKYRFKVAACNAAISDLVRGVQEKVKGRRREEWMQEQREALVLPAPIIPKGSQMHHVYVCSLQMVLRRRKYVSVSD